MAIRASKGPEEVEAAGREVRSVVEEPRRSPALPEEVEEDCTWEAA